MMPDGRNVAGLWTQATSYVIVKDAGNLKVLWTGIAGVFSSAKTEVSSKTTELVTAEMERCLKARAGNPKR